MLGLFIIYKNSFWYKETKYNSRKDNKKGKLYMKQCIFTEALAFILLSVSSEGKALPSLEEREQFLLISFPIADTYHANQNTRGGNQPKETTKLGTLRRGQRKIMRNKLYIPKCIKTLL